jgi:hypothetical protein
MIRGEIDVIFSINSPSSLSLENSIFNMVFPKGEAAVLEKKVYLLGLADRSIPT